MLREAGTTDFTTLLSTEKGLRAATRWFLRCGILSQFSQAKEVYTRRGKRGRRAGHDVDD